MTTPAKKNNKFVESLKKGLNDMKLVTQEGNYKLFAKQAVVIVLLFLGLRYFNGKMDAKVTNIRGQIDALQAQQTNEQDYLANKKKLLELEPRFPDLSAKNDWLLRQVVSVFRDANQTPKLGSAQGEDTSNSAYTVVSIPVTLQSSYGNFGRLVADMENKEEYLKVSEFMLTKSKEQLGQNSINMRISTVFPKEKIAKSLFKDQGEKK